MKRMWVGLCLLLVLLMLGITTSILMPALHLPVAEDLHLASRCALSGDTRQAVSAFRSARQRWEKYRDITASVCDHQPQDDMDALFAEIAFRAETGQWAEFGAGCARLAVMAEDMAKLHGISLPQIL